MNYLKNTLSSYRYNFALDHRKEKPSCLFFKLLEFLRFVVSNKFSKIRWNQSPIISAAQQTKELLGWLRVNTLYGYVYPYDIKVIRGMNVLFNPIASVTPDYGRLLCSSWKQTLNQLESVGQQNEEQKSMLVCWQAVEDLRKRTISELKNQKTDRAIQLVSYLEAMYDKEVEHFDEALQRILFYNGLFWQCKYQQNGIGRLDLILERYYKKDINEGILNYQKAKELLRNFLLVLAHDTASKSAALIGDTGQVIILGGIGADGCTVENPVTHILLELFTENPVPDPKLLLRVNKDTSDAVWQKAIKCILKGSGSPLLINEDVIMPRMVDFGYQKEDVYNFGVSACWEPLIIGKSLDQNNAIRNITILDALSKALQDDSNVSFDVLLSNLDKSIEKLIADYNLNIEFDKSPLQSLFFDDCIAKGKDFSEGGAKYNHHGLLVVGLPNLINSLLNIKEYVFNQHLCTLVDCQNCIEDNFVRHEDLRFLFQQNPLKFGLAKQEIIDLTNHVMDTISSAVAKRNMFGEKIKVGFSSPSYIGLAKDYPASLDGRHKGDPFAVHISPISSNIDISEILDFASSLKYEGNRINGNVVDFIIPASYAKMPDKLVVILKHACEKGIFELQLNVLDKQTLIDAKEHPEKYPNLIVRVWGFSAYFNDLPEEYKDNLIQRAELYE